MPKFPQKGAKMQTVEKLPGMAERNRRLAESAIADLIGLLQQGDADRLHGCVTLQIQSNNGKLGEHTSNYRRDRRNLTNGQSPPKNVKEMNSARLRVAVGILRENICKMIESGFTGSITIEVSFRNGTMHDPVSNLRKFHRI